MPLQRYIQIFTEPPKRENEWHDIEKDIEDALQKNVQRIQQTASAGQRGTRESIYLGDAGQQAVIDPPVVC
jgi:hypothetical protein